MHTLTDLDAFRTIEEITTYVGSVRERMKELDGQYAGKAFPEEARSEWADLKEINDEADARVTELRARLDLLKTIAADPRKVEYTDARRGPDPAPMVIRASRHVPEDIYALEQYRGMSASPEEEEQALIDGARMAIDRAIYPHERADQAETKADLHKLFERIDDPVRLARHILASGNPIYNRAVVRYAAQKSLTAEEDRMLNRSNVRAQTLGTDTQGGFAVPFQLDPTLILTTDGVVNPIRQISRVERITGKKWQGVTTAGVTAQYESSETAQVPAGSFTLAQPEVDTALADVFVPYSITLDLAWGALQSELARIIQDARDTLEADKFINGSGTNEPHGIVATMDPGDNVFVGGSFGIEDIFNLETGTRGLGPRYRPRASFLANKAVYNAIRMQSVGAVGEGSVWVRGIATDRPPQLIGYNAYEASEMDSDTTAAGNDILVFGDFNYFLVVDRIGLTIETVPIIFGANQRPTNQRGVYAYWMNQSLILNQNAFRKLRTGTGS